RARAPGGREPRGVADGGPRRARARADVVPISEGRPARRRVADHRAVGARRVRPASHPPSAAMTVLFLDPVGTLGGAERSLLDLIASLRDAQPTLAIGLIVGSDGELAREAERLAVKVRVLPLPARLARTGDHALG